MVADPRCSTCKGSGQDFTEEWDGHASDFSPRVAEFNIGHRSLRDTEVVGDFLLAPTVRTNLPNLAGVQFRLAVVDSFSIGQAYPMGVKLVLACCHILKVGARTVELVAIAVINLALDWYWAKEGQSYEAVYWSRGLRPVTPKCNVRVAMCTQAISQDSASLRSRAGGIASYSALARYAVDSFVSDDCPPLFKEVRLFLHRDSPPGAMQPDVTRVAAAFILP